MTTTTGKRKAVSVSEPITYERIAARAYDLYLLRGQADGFALSDWLTAETELTAPAPLKKRVSKKAVAMSATDTEGISAKVTTATDTPTKPKTPRQRQATSAPTKKTRA